MEHYTAPSGAKVHVSSQEQAGQRALERGGPKRHEHQLWSFVVSHMSYQAVFDLGANYGQVSLASTYPSHAAITLVEANPGLVPYLERTIATHPDRDRITLCNVALGDHRGTATLYVRTDAVGKSSLIRERGEATAVELTTVDALVSLAPETTDAIVKIDVEGSELPALEGAKGTLEKLANYTIMIELHPGFMRNTAGSVGHYLELLCAYGGLWEQAANGRVRTFDLARFVREDRLRDILIVSGGAHEAAIRAANRTPRPRTSAPRRVVTKLARVVGR